MKKNNSNTNYRRHLLLMLVLVIPFITMLAQGYNQNLYKQGDDGGTVYVNTKAPGVHKEYDAKYGGVVWKNSMGSYICRDENMKPIHDIDKNVFFNGDKNNSWVHKEYDKERKCYIWKDNTGNFLGRDKPEKQDIKNWLDSDDENWMAKGNVPKGTLSESSQLTRKEIKKRLENLEIAQYDAQKNRAKQENDVDMNSRRGGSISLNEESEEGGSVSDVKYEDVDYAQIENLLKNLDSQVAIMSAELARARKQVYDNKYTEYTTLIGNAQATLNHYKQRRQSTRDLAKMVRYADASVEEMDQQLNIIYQALVDAGTVKYYGSTIKQMKSGLNKYRADRKKIRFWGE
jgi:uncharacterized protein YukE